MPGVGFPGGLDAGLKPPSATCSRSGSLITTVEPCTPPVEKARKFGCGDEFVAIDTSNEFKPVDSLSGKHRNSIKSGRPIVGIWPLKKVFAGAPPPIADTMLSSA